MRLAKILDIYPNSFAIWDLLKSAKYLIIKRVQQNKKNRSLTRIGAMHFNNKDPADRPGPLSFVTIQAVRVNLMNRHLSP